MANYFSPNTMIAQIRKLTCTLCVVISFTSHKIVADTTDSESFINSLRAVNAFHYGLLVEFGPMWDVKYQGILARPAEKRGLLASYDYAGWIIRHTDPKRAEIIRVIVYADVVEGSTEIQVRGVKLHVGMYAGSEGYKEVKVQNRNGAEILREVAERANNTVLSYEETMGTGRIIDPSKSEKPASTAEKDE